MSELRQIRRSIMHYEAPSAPGSRDWFHVAISSPDAPDGIRYETVEFELVQVVSFRGDMIVAEEVWEPVPEVAQ